MKKNSSEEFLSMRIMMDFCTIIILQRSAHTSPASGTSWATQLHNHLQTKSGDGSSGDFMFDKIQNLLLLGSGVLQWRQSARLLPGMRIRNSLAK